MKIMPKDFSKQQKNEIKRLRREIEMLRSQLKTNQPDEKVNTINIRKPDQVYLQQASKTELGSPIHFDVKTLKSDLKRTAIFSFLILITLIGISVWQK